MKKIFSSVVPVFFVLSSFAQKETLDLITYIPPKNWEKEIKENITSYTISNKQTSSWCRISIVKSTFSKGSIEQDFESEWQELVVKNYSPIDTPQVNEVQEAAGWKIKAGGAKFTFNNAGAMAMLTTMSGFNRCVSIVAVTNGNDYIKDIEVLLASVDLTKPAKITPAAAPVANYDKNSILGTWGANTSSNSSYRMKNGIMNSISRQYTFKANGTYSFVSKAFDPLMNNILLGKENGTYQVSGNNITINPEKSVLQAWSKKNGTDKWGKLINSQNITLEKQTYQFTKHYFSGIQIWNLVLQADKATQRDGPFSNNSTFTNAWYYGPLSANNITIELPQ